VLVTHDAELAAMADGRLVLRDGRVVESTLPVRPAVTEAPPVAHMADARVRPHEVS
jgi:ABC-type lipoprotein export system ATPase subunit